MKQRVVPCHVLGSMYADNSSCVEKKLSTAMHLHTAWYLDVQPAKQPEAATSSMLAMLRGVEAVISKYCEHAVALFPGAQLHMAAMPYEVVTRSLIGAARSSALLHIRGSMV